MTNSISPSRSPAQRTAGVSPFHVMAILGRAQALAAAGRDVIHLEVGEPDFPTPEPIIDAAHRALQQGHTFYTPACGIPALRAAIAEFYQSRYRVTVDPRRIIVTPGASGALQVALALLVDAGQSVLLPDPTYPCNRHLLNLMDALPISVPVDATSRYQLTAPHIADHWQADTVAAMIASPSNPAGTLIEPAVLADLFAAVQAQGGTLIVDEIYHGLAYGSDPDSALALSDQIFVVNSFSKYFQMTGWRLGWLVVPDWAAETAERLAQNLYLAAPTVAQHAALAAFAPETIAILEARRAEFRRRRDAMLAAFAPLGFQFPLLPDGAFYVYADVSSLTDDSFAFAADILDATGVAITPGRDFGTNAPERYMRLAYTCSAERIQEAADRIGAWLASRA